MFISTILEKNKQIYLFLYILVFICTRWKIFTNTYVMVYAISRLRTINKSISKKVEAFVIFLYLWNGKYVSNFMYGLFLFDWNYSNNNIFLFLQFFPQTVKSLSKTLYLREIENLVWKWTKITKTSSCTKRQLLLRWILCL